MYEFFCKREEAKNLQPKAPESPPLYTNSELVYYQNWKLRYKFISPLIRYCLLNELLNLSIMCWLIFAFLCRKDQDRKNPNIARGGLLEERIIWSQYLDSHLKVDTN